MKKLKQKGQTIDDGKRLEAVDKNFNQIVQLLADRLLYRPEEFLARICEFSQFDGWHILEIVREYARYRPECRDLIRT